MFELRTRTLQTSLVLDLRGPLGREAAEQIMHSIRALSPQPQHLVFNFAEAGPISTAGLGGVLWAVRYVAGAGGQASAYGLSDHFRKVCHVMGITQYVRICADERTALS